MGRRDWELRTCGRRGHETYAPDEPGLRDALHVPTAAGPAWRCLRCGDYVVGPPRGHGPATRAPEVLRGRALRDAFILRVLAVERLLRGVVLAALGAAVIVFRDSQAALDAYFRHHLGAWRRAAHDLDYNLDNSGVVHAIRHALHLRSATLVWVAAALLGYAALELAEGIGLWLLKRWGEYVAVVGTSVFVPLEIYELVERVTWLRVAALVVNVAAVLYILLTKRLFGVRGGRAAYDRERASESLLEVRQAAAATRPVQPAP